MNDDEPLDRLPQNVLMRRLANNYSPPDQLYHYTTPGGLLGILESKCFWATDVRYLNDSKEIEYALELVKDQLAESVDWPNPLDKELAMAWRRATSVLSNTRVYVTCFSRQGDSLSQWRAYARTGYAVGIESKQLSTICGRQSAPTMLLQCIYNRVTQKRLVSEMLQFLSTEFSSALDRGASKAKLLFEYEVHMYGHSLLLAASFKHPKFHEEEEWRVLVRPDESSKSRIGRYVRNGVRWIIPYRKVDLAPPANQRLSVREIVAGPSSNPSLALEGAMVACQEYEIDCQDFRPSEIPFRDW